MGFNIETIFDLINGVEDDLEMGKKVSIHFYTNRANKTTTAIEDGHMLDGIRLIARRYPWVNVDWLCSNKNFYINDKVVATVKCHESDHYDEVVGETEAVKKLNRMVLHQRESAVKAFEKYISKQMSSPASKKSAYHSAK